MGRKIIKSMTLNEISSVDNPAQVGAVAVITKRATAPNQGPQAMKNRQELEAAITKFKSQGATDAEATAIRKGATDLNLTELLKGTSLEAAAPSDDTTSRLAKAEAELAKMGKLSALTPEQRSAYDKMSPEDQAKVIAKSATEVTAELDSAITKAAGSDPVEYTCLDGTELRKSAGVLAIRLAKQNDDLQRRLAKSDAERADESITKRATEDLKNLGGELDVRKALVQAVDGIQDATLREGVLKSLKSANTAASGAFNTNGTTNGTAIAKSAGDASDQLEELAKAHASTNKVPFHQAYQEVIQTPEGRQLYTASLG